MSGEGFLDRWSRRKRAAAAPEVAPETPSDAPEPAEAEAPEDQGPSEEEIAALPPVEDITSDTDLRQYLRKGVPRALRNAALRRKWQLNAAIRDHRDIAVDYAWDWNMPGGVPGDGGPLDRDTVARMAEDLLGPREPATPQPKAETLAAAPQTPPSEGTSQPASRAPEPAQPPPGDPSNDGPTDRNAGAPPARTPDPDPTPSTVEGDAAPRRRHGGAAPV